LNLNVTSNNMDTTLMCGLRIFAGSQGSGAQFGETVYISKVNEANKVKSNTPLAMNKNSDPVQKLFH